MQGGVELLALWVVLDHLEPFEHFVHDFGCHNLPLVPCLKSLLQLLQLSYLLDLLQVYIIDAQSQSVPHLEQVFGKFTNGELLLIFDHLPVSFYSSLIFFHLLCVLYPHHGNLFLLFLCGGLELRDLLFEGFNLCLLLVEQGLDLLNVLFAKLVL